MQEKSPVQSPGGVQNGASLSHCCYMFADNEKPVFRYNELINTFEIIEVTSPTASLIFNYGCAVTRSPSSILLIGGLNKYSDAISKAFLSFNPIDNSITELPAMIKPRYSFSAVLLDNKLYVLGGRTYGGDQEALYRHCEVFDFTTNLWTEIAPMKERRSSFQAFVFRGEIWVLGGYSDIDNRTTIIEKYDPKTNKWTKLPFRLQLGFESGHVISIEDNKVILFGGQSLIGSTHYCHEIDLVEGTVLNISMLPFPCCMGKVFISDKFAYVFGEDDRGVEVFQAFNLATKTWDAFLPNNLNLIMTGFKRVAIGAPTLTVKHSALIPSPKQGAAQCANFHFLFGTDDEPFIVFVDKSSFEMFIYPCPLDLRLKNYQGACRISDTQVLLTGGINREMTRASDYTYIVDLVTFKVTECERLHYPRFAFELVKLGDYVYALGGRQMTDIGVISINKCERFNVLTHKWERIQSMHFSRSSSMATAIKNKIYVAGGFHADSLSVSSIESFDPTTEEWTLHDLQLPLPVEAGAAYYDQNSDRWVMIGGKSAIELMDNIIAVKPPADQYEVTPFNSDAFIVQNRCLHKIWRTDRHLVIFGGTDNFARFSEVLDPQTFYHQDELTEKLQSHLSKTLAKLNFNGNFLRPNSFA